MNENGNNGGLEWLSYFCSAFCFIRCRFFFLLKSHLTVLLFCTHSHGYWRTHWGTLLHRRHRSYCSRKQSLTTRRSVLGSTYSFCLLDAFSLSFCPCQVRPSCDCSLSVSSCFGSIAACFHSWRPSSVYSALLPTCCELEAGMIYPGTQPQTESFNFQGNSGISWGASGAEKYSQLRVSQFILQGSYGHETCYFQAWKDTWKQSNPKGFGKAMEIGLMFLRPNVFIVCFVLFFEFYPKGDTRKILY